jgi:hypothetical protein
MTTFGVHGSEAQVELGSGVDPDQIDVQRRGWGTVLTFMNVRPLGEDADRFVWIHLAIPTPLSLEEVRLKVETVHPITQPELANAMHVWDGGRRIKAWETLDELGAALDHGAWPVNSKLEIGLGLSLKWAFPLPLDPAGAPPQFTVFGAWAVFKPLVDVTQPFRG